MIRSSSQFDRFQIANGLVSVANGDRGDGDLTLFALADLRVLSFRPGSSAGSGMVQITLASGVELTFTARPAELDEPNRLFSALRAAWVAALAPP